MEHHHTPDRQRNRLRNGTPMTLETLRRGELEKCAAANKLRLLLQWLLSTIAIPLGFNHKLSQFCWVCGRSNTVWFWSDKNVWDRIAPSNRYRHGIYCVSCFDKMARQKGICLAWTPTIADTPSQKRLDKDHATN